MNEIQSAAERLRAFKAAIAAGKPDTSAGVEIVDWLWTIADAYLASHPPDDYLEVTEEWLRSVGFEDDRAGCPTISALHINPQAQPERPAYACVRSFPIPVPSARGDVRRLCSALGIELKEGA